MTAIAYGRYVGLPFADHGREGGFDCWGLVRHVLRCERGLLLPDYGDRYARYDDPASVERAIDAGLHEQWQRVAQPQVGGLVIFRIAGLPRHVGLVVDTDRFLHMPSRETSCVERLSSPMWAKRIEGFYVLKDSAAA